MTEKRYSTEFNEKLEMMQYIDNYRGEPNRWAIWNHSETVNLLNKQHETIMRLESEVFKLEQIIKTGKMPVENKEVLVLIAKELYYLITYKDSFDLEEIAEFKKRIKKLEDMGLTELEIIKWIVAICIFFGVILPTIMLMRN